MKRNTNGRAHEDKWPPPMLSSTARQPWPRRRGNDVAVQRSIVRHPAFAGDVIPAAGRGAAACRHKQGGQDQKQTKF